MIRRPQRLHRRGHPPVLHRRPPPTLTRSSVNSLRRRGPQSWAGAYICHGPDNREAAVRACSPLGDPSSVNLELKPSDSTVNPYLSLGAVIHADLDGIRTQADALLVNPATLAEALDVLEADEVLVGALGPLRIRAYPAVKHSGVAAFDRDSAYECFQHLIRY